MRRLGVREKSDERILGRGEFVEQLIKESDQPRKEQFSVQQRLKRAASVVEKLCKKEGVSITELKSGSRRQKVLMVRRQLAKDLVKQCGLSLTETGRHLGVSASAIAKSLSRSAKRESR
jgi:putative transposase